MVMFRYGLKVLAAALALMVLWPGPGAAHENDWRRQVRALARGGAVMAADAAGNTLLAHNPDKALVPASTLKIVTAASALDALGPNYRFVTEFRLSPGNDLYVIGRGDPFLVSEELAVIARKLKSQGLTRVNRIFLDNSFFQKGLALHGTSRSLNPYDAYNGALCANFNTIFVRVGPGQKVVSAEPQTPLTDLARDLAVKNGARGKARFNLAESPDTCLYYAGELIKVFLERAGVEVLGRVIPASKAPAVDPAGFRLFYRHRSSKDLRWLVAQLFKYSNNFMANQIFLTMGAEKYGPPATTEKARRVVADFLTARGLTPFHMEEGSGLSRRTKISAALMIKVLRHFLPYRSLLRPRGQAWFKTGTLSDVKSAAGFLMPEKGPPLSFVILLNGSRTSFRARDRILVLLEENLL